MATSVQIRDLGVRSHDLQQIECVILGASKDNIKNGKFGGPLAVKGNQINCLTHLVNISSSIIRVESSEPSEIE